MDDSSDDLYDPPSFTLTTQWVIPEFNKCTEPLMSPSYGNRYATFDLLYDGGQDPAENMILTFRADGLKTSLKEKLTVTIANQKQAEETVSETFTFSPQSKELAVIFKHPPSYYTTENGFLKDDGSLELRVSFESVDDSATTYDVTSFWPATSYPSTGTTYYSYEYKDDSHEKTGYVGLKNQGATCYMNSMLQSLYHIPAFRRMVYAIHVADDIEETKNIPLNLQRLFCTMQLSDKAVSTTALTTSFGWGSTESFVQHDVHEFCRVLLDKIETKLKGTELENSVADLFKGKSRSYIRCPAVGFESSRIEEFYDVQMVVKGSSNLLESFDKFIETEELTGDNQYKTEEHGKQDAVMGAEFVELPKVLHVHLNRFDFDFELEAQVKINSRFEFPTSLNLNKYLAADCKDKPSEYVLHGILVHSGCVYAGHYYAFLRTTTDPQWYEFNDTHVSKVDASHAIDDNFGGESKTYSGYLLVYVRRDAEEEVFAPVPDESLPKHLVSWLETYKLEQEEMEKQKTQLAVHVLGDNCMKANCKILKSGYENTTEEQLIHMDKDATVGDLLEKLGDDKIVWRCNTYGVPQRVFTDVAKTSVLSAYGYSLWVYSREKDELLSDASTGMTIWVKFFFPALQQPLQFVAPFSVNGHSSIDSLYDAVLNVVGFPPGTPLCCYEEAKSLRLLNPEQTFYDEALCDGKILIFQQEPGTKLLTPKDQFVQETPAAEDKANTGVAEHEKSDVPVKNAVRIPETEKQTVVDYFNAKSDKLEVLVHTLEDPKTPLFWLQFPESTTFKELKLYIAEAAGVDYDPTRNGMELFPGDYDDKTAPSLSAISIRYTQPSFQFARSYLKPGEYYPLFFTIAQDIPEEEISETLLVCLQIADDGNNVNRELRYRIKKGITVATLRQSLIDDNIIDKDIEWRFAETWKHLIYQVFEDKSQINYAASPLLITKVTDEQRKMSPESGDVLLFGCHACKSPEWNSTEAYGCPFYIPVFQNDTVGIVKERIVKNQGLANADAITLHIGDRYTPSNELKNDSVEISTLIKPGEYQCIFLFDKSDAPQAQKKKTSYWRHEEKAIKIDN